MEEIIVRGVEERTEGEWLFERTINKRERAAQQKRTGNRVKEEKTEEGSSARSAKRSITRERFRSRPVSEHAFASFV